MPRVAIFCGLLLIATGLGGYFGADPPRSITALIPLVFGVILAQMGVGGLAMPDARKHWMHAAAGWGLLGAIMAGGRLAMVLMKGGGSPLGLASLAAMAIICAIYVILSVQSFRAARRNRTPE